MRIVTKGTLREIKALTDVERLAVIANYTASNPTQKQHNIAQDIASFAKTSEAWLQCDCMPDEQPAFLFPRQTDSGTITFVRPRPPRQNSHHASCPFHLEALEQTKEHASGRTDSINDFCLLKPEKQPKLEGKNDSKSVGVNKSESIPRLTRILFNLLDASGINKLDDSFPWNDPYLPIYRVASTIPMWPGSKFMLSEALSAHASIAYYYRLLNRLKSHSIFGHDRRKQGYFITLITDFNDYSLTLHGGHTITVVGKVTAPNRVPTGPYWAIIHVAEVREGSNYFDAIRASVWPAYSDRLPFVIDSDIERETLRELISWRLYWHQKGEDYKIIKPLDFNTTVKPDFVVCDKESGAQVVIETMGSNDETYLERKRRMHEAMSKIGPVIEHRSGDNSLSFKKKLTAAIMN